MIHSIQHVSLLVRDTARAVRFYEEVLGMERFEERPDLPFDGAWLIAGGQQIHLLELPSPDPVNGRPEHGGRDRHVAFIVQDIRKLTERLDHFGISYTQSKSGRNALFCRDPDANALEFIQG